MKDIHNNIEFENRDSNKKYGTLYGIGVGPGNEELLTIKAVKILERCDVVIAPTAREQGESIALNTAKNFINSKAEIYLKYFPMKKEKEAEIYENYRFMEKLLSEGKNVVFLTIGDPFVYSTYIYLLEYMKNHNLNIETVPGITSFCAAASLAEQTLVIGHEPLLILPGNRLDSIKDEKYLVIMKYYKNVEQVLDKLEEKGFKYVCVKRAYREGQEILRTREEILNSKDYMSIIIANRE
ncbi:TPA: cobalt-factor II C(20)-methyltransferase [Clostridium botulinum]|uniref:cobalt-factor II C(20)-methyltransferase n=1 Tax=Clostridium botulinum TaxID=1491 RepID=UPI00099D92EA|nr:cobalt-factor II C(20)-methyltransferase [Clostridium botulinum]NFA96664.1 cobalt-factor II C(20)-methyltransferase [Clostridium botulinum]NFB52426.1 cobalt-factor II C(20)-methyltransferase [Clostridium botulinum]NFC75979.1 cobalt-factor II C(20)-methyltransferase [Clostridium botulinum]NFC86732.1 cobalt-factor II C(20)-methyltransferase [Clostridium botulinum]NFD06293.1 cobalt-factor II C(20)-methyltransferase [Clostridium botulinum]